MLNELMKTGRGLSIAGAVASLAATMLLASCGGAEPEVLTAKQREEASALQRAVQLAGETNAAKIKGEQAKRGNPSNP